MARKRIPAPAAAVAREPHHSFDARLTIRLDDGCLHALDRWARREGVTAATLARTILERPGWSDVSAVRNGHVYEIRSTYILQPGPASLTEGVKQLQECIAAAGV